MRTFLQQSRKKVGTPTWMDDHQPYEDPRSEDRCQRDLGRKPPITIDRKAPETNDAFLLSPSTTVYAYNVCGGQLIHPYDGYTVRCCSATGNRYPTLG